jgi:hypothetical protein
MKLPKKVNIKGAVYSLATKDLQKEACQGYCDNEKLEIAIDKSLKGESLKSSLIHEIFHGALYQVSMHQTSLTVDQEEIIVDVLSNVVVCLFDISWKKQRVNNGPGKSKKRNT